MPLFLYYKEKLVQSYKNFPTFPHFTLFFSYKRQIYFYLTIHNLLLH